MTTNLLATVVTILVTNVSSYDNGIRSPQNGYFYAQGWQQGGTIKDPTEKTETETVVEIKKLEFDIEGVHRSIELSQREVKRTARTYKLNQDWKLTDVNTNLMAGYATNIMLYNFIGLTNMFVIKNITNDIPKETK